MELYNYFRSSASYRVRIALALKGLLRQVGIDPPHWHGVGVAAQGARVRLLR